MMTGATLRSARRCVSVLKAPLFLSGVFVVYAALNVSPASANQEESTPKAVVHCEKRVETADAITVQRARVVAFNGGKIQIAWLDGEVRRGANDEPQAFLNQGLARSAACRFTAPFEFVCTITDSQSPISGLSGTAAMNDDGEKIITITRVYRDSSPKTMEFGEGDCQPR